MVAATPLTIGTLRDQHLQLMREWRSLDDHGRVERAAAMRAEAVDAARNIESPAERDEAQGIVDYWASSIAVLPNQAYPELLTIQPYVPTQAAESARTVSETFDHLTPSEAQRIARRILEDLLLLGDHGVERDRPQSRQALRKSAGATDKALFDHVLEVLVEAGAIVRRPSEVPDDDCFEAVDGRIAESWPALNEWLESAKTRNAERAFLMDQAQQWQAANRSPAYLLRGAAIDHAMAFRNENDLLDAFIQTSHGARNKGRRTFLGLILYALAVTTGALFYYYMLLKQEHALRKKAEETVLVAQAKDRVADSKNLAADRKNQEAQANAAVASLPDAVSSVEFEKAVQAIAPASDAHIESGLDKLAILSGAMWLGSDKTPQVANLQGGAVSQFARAMPGTRYRARIQIYLREAMPSSTDYAPARQKAIVPAGAQIILISRPAGYRRATGVQYWAQVRVVPQVYVQYNNASKAQANEIRRAIAASGFEVPAGEFRRDFVNHAEIRYLQPSDAAAASVLQRTLNTIPGLARAGTVDCRLFPGAPAGGPNFKLEFWFDARRASGSSSGKPCR